MGETTEFPGVHQTWTLNTDLLDYGTNSAGRKRGCGGVAPTAGVPPLHPVLTLLRSAIQAGQVG
jgi:hypothetical protein